MANDPNETPFNYDDCVDASSVYVDAVDTATDTFKDWGHDNTTSAWDVIGDAVDIYPAYDHKEEVCNFGQDADHSFSGWVDTDHNDGGFDINF